MSDEKQETIYTELGGDRPMREVLDERKKLARAAPSGQRELAFRERAWMQAMLHQCLCSFPIIEATTDSKHETWCPAHQMLLSKREAERIALERQAGRMPP